MVVLPHGWPVGVIDCQQQPMTLFHVQLGALVVATASAVIGLYTYWRNSRTKAAEFLFALHQSFFVDATYKRVRDTLDNKNGSAAHKVHRYIDEQPAEFTDFLNFFELVAYMESCKNLSRGDVKALLGYYLQLFLDDHDLYAYISDIKSNGFEHLAGLLKRLKAEDGRIGA